MDHINYTLPGGYLDNRGALHRDVEITPLSGCEEELLACKEIYSEALLITEILTRCITRLGTLSPVNQEIAHNLLVGDRQFLVLKLRELTFGKKICATIHCPWVDCGSKVDIDFSTKDIPIRESENKGPYYTMELSPEASFIGDQGEEYRKVVFRLPNGSDQERILPLISQDEPYALSKLLERCILRIGPLKNNGNGFIHKLSPKTQVEIQEEMERIAPKVDLTITGDCPNCNREFEFPFDLYHFFLLEMRIGIEQLYKEVHYLAYHYHWSEREIMGMTRGKRHKYIEILAEEIEDLNNAF